MENYYWTMKNGQKINVDDMDINHLRNTLKLIMRRADAKAKAIVAAKAKSTFRLRGDIAQDHYDTMMDILYSNEMDYDPVL
jgi:mannitol-specific phosphotransferase system IIBC component